MSAEKPSYALKTSAAGPRMTTRRRGDRFATLEVENPGDERITIREVDIVDIDGACGDAGARLTVRAPVLLRPHARKTLPVPIDIPDTAAPGTYRFIVEFGGAAQEVQINVATRARIRLSPAVIHVQGSGKTAHDMVVQNLGNVVATISGTIAVPLDDELIVCRSLRAAMNVFDERATEDVTIDRIVAEGFRHARGALEGAIVGVHFEEVSIEPGRERVVRVTIDTPSTLDARSRYTAAVPVLSATLGVTVLPRQIGQFVVPDVPEPARPPTAKKATAKKTAAKATAKKTTKKSPRKK